MRVNKVITVLLVILVIMVLVLAGTVGMIWYRTTHVFVDGEAYPMNAEFLDLREEEVSLDHYKALQAQLPGCKIIWNVPFQGGAVSSDAKEITVKTLTQEDVEQIVTYLPAVQKVNASECQDYLALKTLAEKRPELEVQYSVNLGGASFAPDSEALVLNVGDYNFDTMLENLPYLPQVKSIQFKTPDLSLEQVNQLRETFPEVEIACTVEIMGKEYDTETTQLDLSMMTAKDVPEVAEKLGMLSGLELVELMNKDGESNLTKEDVKALMEAAPETNFHYVFDFYGVKISTTDEEVVVKNKRIKDEGEAEVRLALDLMQNCKRFVLDNCHISNEVMAKIREDYRDKTKVVWRIYFGEGTSMTDAEILRSTYNVTDDNSHDLIYCEDVRYMDLGHNEFLDYVPFVEGMPKLEVVIVSGAPIKDLSPFANCKDLRILEIANCLYIPDLKPLAACEKLEMLNISYTRLTDLSPIDKLPLTHLMAVHNKIPDEEEERYAKEHPDTLSIFQGDQPYGTGWRYDEDNKPLPWYADIKEVFRYPKAPNNVGWYLKKDDKK